MGACVVLGALLHALRLNYADGSFSASDALKKAETPYFDENCITDEAQLSNALDEFKTGHIDLTSKSLGRILLYRKDRIVDGLYLEKAGDVKGTSQWRVRCHETCAP
jgi:hypothetical protein